MVFLIRKGDSDGLQEIQMLATTIMLVAGAGLLRQVTCRRRKADSTHAASKSSPSSRSSTPESSPSDRSTDSEHLYPLSEAERCWAGEYGRYKYTALRPNVFDKTVEPPAYSLEPLNLPLPPLGDDEARGLQELAARVKDLADAGHRTDLATLLRYLRARKGKVDKADELFRKACAVREEHDVDRAFSHWDLEAFERILAPWWLSGGIIGYGLQGEPVAIERIGHCSWPKLMHEVPFHVLEKIDLVHSMRCLGACEEDAVRRGVPFGGVTLIMDLHGFGWDQIQFRAAYNLSKLSTNRQLLMPETVKRLLFVRTPPAFVRAWGMFSYLMDPGTLEKLHMATEADTLQLLRKFVSDDCIPAFLGGRLCVDGDPECRKICAPGGLPPQEALQRLKRQLEMTGGIARPKNGESPDEDYSLEPYSGDSHCTACGICPRRNS